MRIDKFLKVSRLIKRRAVANEACDQGRVTVNGKVAKASHDIKEGDVLEIKMGERVTKVKIINVAEHVLKNDASSLYEVIN
ncbi:MAG TPA: RNA-binding S4 domain-containing protein [Candidatus Ornithomonoglobus intestinigallinarum]|uniref:RQC P-site tRNA stabilizing factor n=1 Tax=Candidatus Ornithomonoglobus intestinigallinarum TaxID=2840894 RepID=A0A9D1KPU4_9FIRM|nr:RNA-binding S4 domain-containing protein [Candidatus Ornithomonoglobus intestinigallinarum]